MLQKYRSADRRRPSIPSPTHHSAPTSPRSVSPTPSSSSSRRQSFFSHSTAHGGLSLAPHVDSLPAPALNDPNADPFLLDHADLAMQNLRSLALDSVSWKPVLTHKSGAVVYSRKATKTDPIPVYKGVALVAGFAPDAIFALIKSRGLWDEWYLEGHMVETVTDDVTLNYMVMKPPTQMANPRDLALLDRRDYDPVSGTIAYASTSVDTTKIPKYPGRIRAFLKLNGWILEPLVAPNGTVSTRVSYYIQTDVGGFIPGPLVKKYLTKRALVVVAMEEYLKRFGPPKIAVNERHRDSMQRERAFSHLRNSEAPSLSSSERPPRTTAELRR
ncbi:hypothetical protein BDK51DRAFT_44125 [Blyttiomyces helicus]|uniref:START domain-containing protein n=1 Tax=Blyttiomyces helicus TaxID=388810 RepID=A0A4P9WIF2_9FUNG|nr:hypothetical protein BDK51DRAFT_44125 [Blyttiomyces helicus]|eukprot:RKO92554.1 hypothetical protein BDK51DRAFT_44125 [Blyttiomyces helicus]